MLAGLSMCFVKSSTISLYAAGKALEVGPVQCMASLATGLDAGVIADSRDVIRVLTLLSCKPVAHPTSVVLFLVVPYHRRVGTCGDMARSSKQKGHRCTCGFKRGGANKPIIGSS